MKIGVQSPKSEVGSPNSEVRSPNSEVQRQSDLGNIGADALPGGRWFSLKPTSGFTMIEIAISLAVIGFALVAIIGVLPTGMSVQRDNRQETIINQDATIFMDAIRHGERGLDDLTNYVFRLENPYTKTNINNPISGAQIIGLLSTPRRTADPTNHFTAYVRPSISGPASEKFPQSNPSVQDLALSYKMIADIIPVECAPPSDPTNGWVVANLTGNLYEVRLTFRWPLLPDNVSTGPGRQVFRTMVSGVLTNDPAPDRALWFFQPRTYVKKAP